MLADLLYVPHIDKVSGTLFGNKTLVTFSTPITKDDLKNGYMAKAYSGKPVNKLHNAVNLQVPYMELEDLLRQLDAAGYTLLTLDFQIGRGTYSLNWDGDTPYTMVELETPANKHESFGSVFMPIAATNLLNISKVLIHPAFQKVVQHIVDTDSLIGK